MPLPTTNDVQLVEPVLTNLLVGYMQSADRFVAMRAFPSISVENDSGTIPQFTKKYWFVDGLEERAHGDAYARGGYGITSSTYKTLQYGREKVIADETRANSQIPFDLERAATEWLGQQSLIRKERAFASAAFGASAWGTTATGGSTFTKWSDYGSSDPYNDVRTGVRTISQNTGYSPNLFVCGEIVIDKLENHPDLIDRLKYTQAATGGNVRGALAAIFDLQQILVSRAIYNSANEGQDASMSVIIDDDALLLFTNPTNTLMSPTAGRSFVWQPGGGAGQILMYRENQTDSDVVKLKEQWQFKVVASDVGYEFVDCVD